MKSISTSLQFVLLAINGTGFTWNHLQKLVASLLILSVMGCGSIKGDNQASLNESVLPKIYTGTDILIGDYLGTTTKTGSGNVGVLLAVRFSDGVFGAISIQSPGTSSVGVVLPLLSNLQANTNLSCYYKSADCSGDCFLALGGSIARLKNAIAGHDGTSLLYYTGKESLQTLSQDFSSRSFDAEYYDGIPYPSSTVCTHTVGPIATPISVIKPSRWNPPNGLTFPITGEVILR